MKKIFILLLASVIITGSCISTSAWVNIPLEGIIKYIADYDEIHHSAVQVKPGQTVGHYFVSPEPVKKYKFHCPSYSDNVGAFTASIYKWAGSYDATLQTEPYATQRYENFNDNAYLELYIDGFECYGELLMVLSDAEQLVGVWVTTEINAGQTSCVYADGKVMENTAFGGELMVGFKTLVNEVEKTPVSAYSRIEAEKADVKVPNIAVRSDYVVVNGKYTSLGFADVDFGSTSPKGLEVRVFPNEITFGDVLVIQIKADDPENGALLGEVYCEYEGQAFEWVTLSDDIKASITGVHDVYMVFYGLTFYVDWFRFTKTAPGPSFYEERIANFVPVEDSELTDLYADTWSATDMMGRKLPGHETVGDYDPERQIGIFYWTWHAQPSYLKYMRGMYNNEATLKKYLRSNPGGTEADIKNVYSWINADGTTGDWGVDGTHWWNESVYGYYNGLDTWVMRKHMELLGAAGVDGLFFDTTNGTWTWTGGYMALAKTIHEMKQDGVDAPGMSFILPFFDMDNNVEDLRRIYQSMYGVGLYSDTWYYWDGKPVLMAYPDNLSKPTGYEDIDSLHSEIADFFTFRPGQASYFDGPKGINDWPWLEKYPQNGYIPLTNSKYNYECVAVGVAQNANDNGLTAMNGDGVYGRSYTYKNKHALLSEESKYYGYNFQEQWERAFELNPKMVFITGWNEWSVGHQETWIGVDWAFADQYRDEYSRDIEPTKGDFKDNYYYQMVANIRKFKGVRETPTASVAKTIRIGGAFSQWDSIEPSFHGYTGGTGLRDFYGQQKANHYYNDTGRNDIVLSKVARDTDNLYFYVKTAENLTSYTDPAWMRLFINTDRTYKTGWEGYDFAVNIDNPTSATSTTLSYSADGWNWKTVGNLTYKYSGNQMMIRISRDMLGLTDKLVDIEFKWNDNMQNQGDIMDVYNNGDTAPIGRFAYRYTETTDYDKTPADEPVTVAQLKENQHKHSVIMAIGNTTAFASGKAQTLDVAPALINEKTMIPLRFFSEGFGAKVEWKDSTRTATVELDGNAVSITVGKNTMDANGTEVALESPAVIKDGRILVPMRDIAEALGKQVLWVDGGLIIAGENPETVHSYEWVQDMTEDNFGIR